MNSLKLPNPRMMDVAVPANLHQGLHQEEIAKRGWALSAEEAIRLIGRDDTEFIDLREDNERERQGMIPGSLHAPYTELTVNLLPGGIIRDHAADPGRQVLLYCAFGERSAMAVRAARSAGMDTVRHIHGGIAAWKKANGPLA